MTTFHLKLKAVRVYLALSQTKLAQQSNLTQADINGLESGKTLPTPTTQQQLEQALKVNFNVPIIIPVEGSLISLTPHHSVKLLGAVSVTEALPEVT